jgi:Fic family protein
MVSRRVRERHSGPYQAAIVPPIADLDVVLASEDVALADSASVEIARFDAEMGTDIAPFAAILLRSESAASSRIERLTASAKAIALAEIGDDGRQNAAEIVANTRTMQAAIDLADRLDTEAILAMHRALMESHAPDIAGRWRTEQVWIGGSDYGPHQADFVPPHHDRVSNAMADLIRFVQRDDIPTLIHTAIAHAQFETVHPFADGNGRTGRALVHAMMRAKGLTRHVTVPVSAGLLTDTDAYFAALDAYRAGDASRIVTLMAQAAFTAIENGRQLVADLHDTRERWDGLIQARRDAAVWRLADLVLRQPVIDIEVATEELGTTSANAHRAIRQLFEAGILTEFSGRRRRQRWLSTEVLSALDDFAVRARRPCHLAAASGLSPGYVGRADSRVASSGDTYPSRSSASRSGSGTKARRR